MRIAVPEFASNHWRTQIKAKPKARLEMLPLLCSFLPLGRSTDVQHITSLR
jgi:hypothetical protein